MSLGQAQFVRIEVLSGKAEMARDLNAMVKRAIDVYTDKRNQRQIAIDTPQEYKRIELACPNN